MRLLSVHCEKFRQYKKLELKFPKTKECDIHIVEASNGVGKTNFLNAINWCLYGDEPHVSGMMQRDAQSRNLDNSANSLPLYNIEALQEAKDTYQEKCTVSVTVKIEIDGEEYSFERSQEFKVSSGVPIGKSKVNCNMIDNNGTTHILTDEERELKINAVLPVQIREYFYFDGEQLLTYFNENKRQNVKNNVYKIAQIDTLESVRKHLEKVADIYKREYNNKDPKLGEKEKNLESLKDAYRENKTRLDEINNELKIARDTIREIDAVINGREHLVEINKTYQTSLKLREKHEADLASLNNQITKFVREFIIKILLYKNNKKVNDYVEERQKNDTGFTDLRESDIQESIDACRCKLCGEYMDYGKVQELLKLLEKIRGNTSVQKIVGIANEVKKALDIHNFPTKQQELFDKLVKLQKDIEDNEATIDEAYKKLKQYGAHEADDVSDKINKKKDFERQVEQLTGDKAKVEVHLEQLRRDKDKAEAEYNSACKSAADQEKTGNYWAFTQNAKKKIDGVISDIAEENRNRIAERTTDIFDKLIWKKDVYGKVELSDDYTLKLYHKYNNKSCLDSCSAAETELLALAFTLAVHEVSGYSSFLLIDTPVGRVSDSNRKNFAQVLLDVSTEKQIILEVTPSEYSNEIKDVFNRNVISSYVKLNLHNNNVIKES